MKKKVDILMQRDLTENLVMFKVEVYPVEI